MRLIQLLLSATLALPGVWAWGAAGHEIIATIAQIHLHPSVFPTICTILNYSSPNPDEPQCHLAPVAAWADNIKYKMRWSAPLHYINARDDYPPHTCAFPGPRGWAGTQGGNVLGAIRNVTNILEEWGDGVAMNYPDDSANEALKFLVHFLGDLHMPLHLAGRDRGGNSQKVRFDGRITNLHSLWDSLLIAKAIREVPRNYSRHLPYKQVESSLRGTIYDSYVRRIMWEGILDQWKDEVSDWISCPATTESSPSTPRGSFWQQVLSIMNTFMSGGDVARDTDDDTLCPYHWARPIQELNCELVWPRALDEPPYKQVIGVESSDLESLIDHIEEEISFDDADEYYVDGQKKIYLELDTPEYAGVISKTMLVEKLLAQAGIRLAAVINWLFADLEVVGGEIRRGGLRVVEL